jgi:starch phosphorylase
MDSPKTKAKLQELLNFHLRYSLGIQAENASTHDWFTALALTTRNYLIDSMFETQARYDKAEAKRCYYLSMEFLMGRLLSSNLHNLGIFDIAKEVLSDMGQHLENIEEAEADAALGNGGLGRLAACFLDSLATMDMPGYGYGINYEFGLFRQHIEHGHQKERPDHWLHEDTPWLIERTDEICAVPLYGRIEHTHGPNGEYRPLWVEQQVIIGVPFDMPVAGCGGNTVNYLRLYSARASHEFNIKIFNGGDYIKAVEAKISSENISKVLYPSDSCWGGKELRLVQEYFLVACALRDVINRHLRVYKDLHRLPEKAVFQLNDTHPALTVAELMRILLDEHHFHWHEAWQITQQSCAYTNHTLLPEALEKWPVILLEKVLPRHLQIIYEINHRFLDSVAQRWPNDMEKQGRLSLFEEGGDKQVRMAHLAIVGSFSVNGVAALHSELVKTRLVPDFHAMWPDRFNNKTNGVTPRRWMMQSNPGLAALLRESIGSDWIKDLSQLKQLEKFADDSAFQDKFNAVKLANKERLARLIAQSLQLELNPGAMFDVQIKRIHEYKRQLLNILHVMHEYLSIIEDGKTLPAPQVYIFGGKAAPGYVMAKLIIKLINNVGMIVNHDLRVKDQLKIAFLPDYRVSLAEKIIPAANLSEQISTAGTEASGTGNMKFAMNGALTIGTLDGANVEIREEVGADNIYIFGLTTEEVERMRRERAYNSRDYYNNNPLINRVLSSLANNRFSPDEPGIFEPIYTMLLDGGDYFYHLADLQSYCDMHETVARDYTDSPTWTRKAILNVARMGKFSSDRTIQEYAKDIWRIKSFTPET